MIEVEELRALIRHDQQPLSDIEGIFRALVGYPGEEEIRNAGPFTLVDALRAACEALIGDGNIVPSEIADLVIDETDGAPVDRTYGGLAAAVAEHPDRFRGRLTG